MENDKYVPYLKHINEGGTAINQGTRKNPNFLYTSHGGRNKSVIYHTEEEGKLYQYHKSSVNRDDVSLYCMYRKNRRANCRAEFKAKPKNDEFIYKRKINGKVRYFLSDEIKFDDQSGADWETVGESGIHEHSEYCKNQVAKADQPNLDDYVRDQMSGREMQEFNKKYCRFGPFEPLARDLRYKHTRAAIKHHTLKLDHVVK